jgi:hypothetical protein
MVAIRLVDEAERELPNIGLVQFFNAETGQTTWVNSTSDEAQKLHRKLHEEEESVLLNSLLKSGVDFVSISTDEDFIKPLIKLFKQR